ncbi:amidohydrolase family protein [Streptomyces olivaceus]
MERIDIHSHVISPDTRTYPPAPLGGVRSSWSQERTSTVETLIAAMDAAGVDKSVVVQVATVYGFDNSYVADSVDRYPDRLLGVGSVDFLADDALDRLRHWVDERGFVGVRLFLAGTTMTRRATWLDDPRTYAAWKWVQDAGVPVCVKSRVEGADQIENVLARFPDVVLVVDHAASPVMDGGPPYEKSRPLLELNRHPNVFLKFTNDNVERADPEFGGARGLIGALVSEFGSDRIAWGSNFPATQGSLEELTWSAEDTLAELTETQRRDILGGTARRIYRGLDGLDTLQGGAA